MPDAADLKQQRDRFLAFAFASSDMFMEISEEGTVLFATGAINSLTGEDAKSIEGSNWLDLFSPFEQARMMALQEEIPNGVRCGPFLIDLDRRKSDRKAVLSGIKMPYSRSFYIAISLSNELMEEMAAGMEEEFDDSLYNRHQFIDEAEKIFEFARTRDIDADITVFDFGRTQAIPEEDWAAVMGKLAEHLRENSLDGRAVGELSEGRYSFIHDHDINPQDVFDQITDIIKEQYPKASDIKITSQTVNTDTKNLTSEEQKTALFHTVTEAARSPDLPDIETLGEGLKTLVVDNEAKIAEFKGYIDRVSFKFEYQPVARLNNHELFHYEMLCRFENGSTRDWVKFGEDTGLIPGLDLAVCERVTNHLAYKVGGTRTQYSMNISPLSIANASFSEKFFEILDKHKNMHERLIIEITDARKAIPSKELKEFLFLLKSKEYKITLDNLGADSKSIWLLDELECDFVKIDGLYTHKIHNSGHERSMVQNLTKTCLSRGIKTIGKMVETAEDADAYKSVSCEYAQGYYFGKPQSQPSYQPPKD